MKKNNLQNLTIFLVGLLVVSVCFATNQLPSGNTNRVYERWEWRDATLQSVASHIASVSGVDIVVDANIASETINISLRNRTWQEVLKIICHTKNWSFRVLNDGSYIYIADERELNDRLVRDAQSARNLEALENLEILTIRLRNTTAEDMMEPIRGVLSQRGRVVPVRHTNSLIIHELSRNVENVMNFIDEMDQEMLQISISAKIVEIGSTATQAMGVQWSFFDTRGNSISTSGGVADPFARATFGVLDPMGFTMAMEYLHSNSNVEIVAEPQITTLENREARIFMGSQIPIARRDEAGNTVTEMLNARTELIVTPTVTGQGQIRMNLRPTKTSYAQAPGIGEGFVINEQGAQTNVIVQDGETIVIAGLTSDDTQERRSGIPFLQDIPILGHLFKNQNRRNEKRDLVIFVTPHVIKRTKLDLFREEEISATTSAAIFEVLPQ